MPRSWGDPREFVEDVAGDAVSQILKLRVAGVVQERKYGHHR